MAAFVFKPAPEALPKVTFVDAAGKERTLDDWKGKVVLLNLWATWCAPCRKEMPGLDRLQAELGSDKFEVVAVSVDRTGIAGAKKFLDQIKVEKLAVLADPTARMGTTLRAIGMPATLLLDAEGREIGRLVGPAEWDTPEGKALIQSVRFASFSCRGRQRLRLHAPRDYIPVEHLRLAAFGRYNDLDREPPPILGHSGARRARGTNSDRR